MSQTAGSSAVIMDRNRALGTRGGNMPFKCGPDQALSQAPGGILPEAWGKLGESSERSSLYDHRVGIIEYYNVQKQLIIPLMTPRRRQAQEG